MACGINNDNGREMSSDTSDRGTAGKLRLAADGAQDRYAKTWENDLESRKVAPGGSMLSPVEAERHEPHRPGLEPGTFGSVDRCGESTTTDAATACDSHGTDMSSCMSFLKQTEPDLARIATAWPDLPDHIKATIITLIESSRVPDDDSE